MLKIRLRRMGSKHRPFYRVVVSDSRKFPTASALDEVGYYCAINSIMQPPLEEEPIEHWVGQGAQMSSTVEKLLKRQTAPAA